jgi:hypothetical protein
MRGPRFATAAPRRVSHRVLALAAALRWLAEETTVRAPRPPEYCHAVAHHQGERNRQEINWIGLPLEGCPAVAWEMRGSPRSLGVDSRPEYIKQGVEGSLQRLRLGKGFLTGKITEDTSFAPKSWSE